ncbi:techylectin-5B-like isoform X1 [Drosophila montana]|uniref:techylectin-5B-like isoform X1 n=1 Tax=Drosophila montana TaxID=40370 RepID=UPI00313BBCC3
MRIKEVYILKLLLLMAAVTVCATSNSVEDNLINSNDQCSSFCFNSLKPLLDNAIETKNKIESCDVSIRDKDEKIQKLQKQLAASEMNASIFNQIENIYNEKSKYKDKLIAALEEKSGIDKNEIESIKLQLDANTEALKVLKNQLASLNSSVSLHNYNAKQQHEELVQVQAMNCVPFENSTGVHDIDVAGFGKVSVLCDSQTAGPGWTVVQRRFDGSVDFYRNWSEYRKGFGSLTGEFFLGLEILYHMTKSLPYELYIQLVDFNNVSRHARYDSFLIGSEDEQYMLKSLGTYSGNAGNALRYNLYDSFTTYDQDHDGWTSGNCAQWYSSGWWYNLYGNSNLNGKYFYDEVNNQESIWWYNWKGYNALKSVQMMIRPKYTSI